MSTKEEYVIWKRKGKCDVCGKSEAINLSLYLKNAEILQHYHLETNAWICRQCWKRYCYEKDQNYIEPTPPPEDQWTCEKCGNTTFLIYSPKCNPYDLEEPYNQRITCAKCYTETAILILKDSS